MRGETPDRYSACRAGDRCRRAAAAPRRPGRRRTPRSTVRRRSGRRPGRAGPRAPALRPARARAPRAPAGASDRAALRAGRRSRPTERVHQQQRALQVEDGITHGDRRSAARARACAVSQLGVRRRDDDLDLVGPAPRARGTRPSSRWQLTVIPPSSAAAALSGCPSMSVASDSRSPARCGAGQQLRRAAAPPPSPRRCCRARRASGCRSRPRCARPARDGRGARARGGTRVSIRFSPPARPRRSPGLDRVGRVGPDLHDADAEVELHRDRERVEARAEIADRPAGIRELRAVLTIRRAGLTPGSARAAPVRGHDLAFRSCPHCPGGAWPPMP